MRISDKVRETNETKIEVKLNLDGAGVHNINTGIKFFDHMLSQVASHGLFDLNINALSKDGDNHHLVEDVALTLGAAFLDALGDKKGISRYAEKTLPMDEALVQCVIDFSGRPYSKISLNLNDYKTSDFETVLVPHFFSSFAQTSNSTIHIRMIDGFDSHHIIEASFKAFARAIRDAVSIDERLNNKIPSTKGCL